MMKWSHTLIAGSALILLTNAVALLGAAYNRSDDYESRLQLSQRELHLDRWNEIKDNSGMTLKLDWRIAPVQQDDDAPEFYAGKWGTPAWLNKNKMAELGFDVVKLASTSENDRHYKELLSREVLLVLELNDRVYLQGLKLAKAYAEQARVLQAENPKNETFKRRAISAEKNYQRELHDNSRLFVVDAGVDLQKLRSAYPARTHYAIVRGLVRAGIVRGKDGGIRGHIDELHAERINVPYKYRQAFDKAAPYEVTVAFGKRLEPWITGASRSMAAK